MLEYTALRSSANASKVVWSVVGSPQEVSTFLEALQALFHLFLLGLVWGSSQHVGLQLLQLEFEESLLVS